MVESSEGPALRTASAIAELERCSQLLQLAIETALEVASEGKAETEASPQDQLAAENAVAAGVSVLAGEDAPEPATAPSARPTLAKDLLITVDLVLRSLQSHPAP